MRIRVKNILTIFLTTALAVGALATAQSAEWGSIKGRFVVDGTPAALPPLNYAMSTDPYCTNLKPANKALLVGEKGALANAVVFLRLNRDEKVEVHPDYAAGLATPAVLDNKGCEFHPHVALVRVGQPFVIKNSDPTGHNTKYELTNAKFNESIPAGEERKVTFTRAEAQPGAVNCSIHPFMEGHLLVQDHPYMAASGEDGSFEIKNIPAGRHAFQFWHERGNLRDVKFAGGVVDRRGRAEITVKAGQTLDLGDIKVPASLLK
jgi:plastocyanin